MPEDKLFSKCTNCEWDEVRNMIAAYPSGACAPIDSGKKGAAKISVLQVVLAHPKCRGSVPLDIISMLLKMAPQMAETKHMYTGNLPLHAVFYNAFFSSSKRATIAEMIIRANPQSVLMTNYDGRTPLHTNCTQHCNYEPVVALLKAAPQTAQWKDKNDELPLHLACRSQKTPNKSIRALFHAFPEGIFCRNGQGMTPLEIAKSAKIMEQRKMSRVALLKTLETQLRKNKKHFAEAGINYRGKIMGYEEEKSIDESDTFEDSNTQANESCKRKLDEISNNESILNVQKSFQRCMELHHLRVSGNFYVGIPMISQRVVVPNYLDTIFYNASRPKIPIFNSKDRVYNDSPEIFAALKPVRSHYNRFEQKRKHLHQPQNTVQAEASCAIALMSLKNQNR